MDSNLKNFLKSFLKIRHHVKIVGKFFVCDKSKENFKIEKDGDVLEKKIINEYTIDSPEIESFFLKTF